MRATAPRLTAGRSAFAPCPLVRATSCSRPLFSERFLAALPPAHALTGRTVITEEDLATDILCADRRALPAQPGPRSLPTLFNMVAAGDGTTVIPALAAQSSRTIRIAWRPRFPRTAAVEAVGDVIAGRLRGFTEASEAPAPTEA